MTGQEHEFSFLILLVGLLLGGCVLIRFTLTAIGFSPVVGYLLLGIGVGALDHWLGFLSSTVRTGLGFLSHAGIVALLFQVGLESDPAEMGRELPRAGWAWIGSVLPSALLGYLITYYLFGFGQLPSLFVATALSATSVGVSLAPWREAGVVRSRNGALLLDLAELDDVSGILFMALLLGVAPALIAGNNDIILPTIMTLILVLVLKLTAFGAFCLVFAKLAAARLTRWALRHGPPPYPMLILAGIGFAIAAVAGYIGFSLAIGAVLAGLAFSGNADRDQIDQSLKPIFELFAPFFFIGIGLAVDFATIGTALGLGGVLLVVAVAGKFLGTTAAVARAIGWPSAAVIGMSMVPRAEIAMIIMLHGRDLGDRAVPEELFGAMAFVSVATCLLAPILVRFALARQARS
jgi:Kef-type K+ transport system membrane component KefB